MLHFDRDHSENPLNLLGKTRPSFLQKFPNVQSIRGESMNEVAVFDSLRAKGIVQPRRSVSHVERDGGGVGRDHSTWALAVAFVKSRVRRDTSPANDPGQAEMIKPARIVVCDSRREDGFFPLDGRRLEAFQFCDRFEQSIFSRDLGLRRKMLPSEEPTHES